MTKEKADRNKTLDKPLSQCEEFLSRCITVTEHVDSPQSILNKTINGDTLSVCSLLPQNFVDLIIADPPYNLRKSFNGTTFSKKKASEYEEYTYSWLKAIKPLLKPNGSVYVCCDWESSLIIGSVMSELFTVKNRITWQREKGRGAKANWKNSMEDIWFATNSEDYTFNLDAVKIRRRVIAPYRTDGKPKGWSEDDGVLFRDTCPSNLWDDITVPFWSMPENTAHPTQKPEKLLAKIILASSNENDVVFDPFLGSGTTSVAAKKLNRRYIGIEREPLYCAWTEERLQNAIVNPEIQGYSGGVFWERNSLPEQKKSGL